MSSYLGQFMLMKIESIKKNNAWMKYFLYLLLWLINLNLHIAPLFLKPFPRPPIKVDWFKGGEDIVNYTHSYILTGTEQQSHSNIGINPKNSYFDNRREFVSKDSKINDIFLILQFPFYWYKENMSLASHS